MCAIAKSLRVPLESLIGMMNRTDAATWSSRPNTAGSAPGGTGPMTAPGTLSRPAAKS